MKRILLFLATNVAILVVLSIVMRLVGIDSLLAEQGTQLDLRALLIFSAVIGFAGSLISLAISKWSAKRLTGATVIETPRNATESWLLNTVQRQAQVAGIGTPEVAVYESPEVNAFATGAGGAKLAGRDSMIGALEGLQRLHQPSQLPESMQAFGISAGRARGFRRLFMSHPPLEERIAALKNS